MKLDVVIPIEVTSNINKNEHFMARTRRVNAEHNAVEVALHNAWEHWGQPYLRSHLLDNPEAGARVTMLRPFKAKALDSDNASNAFKNVRDYIASFLGLDDATDRIYWRVVQVPAHTTYSNVHDAPKCRAVTGTKSHKLCSLCKEIKPDTHVRIRIEIVPAADVDPMKLAVRVLRKVVADIANDMECCAGYSDAEITAAIAQADQLATFDPQEMYR